MASKSQSSVPSEGCILLIPWDTTSPDHVERMIQQRIACGWDYDASIVQDWKSKQEAGKLNLQWIVLSPNHALTAELLQKHTTRYPLEAASLLNTASFFAGKERTPPSPHISFTPIGHVCLGPPSAHYIEAGYVTPEPGLYWIAIFYISRALQSLGLGSMTLDTVERIAISEPLNAKVLTLNAISKVDPDREEKYKALGLDLPAFSNQEWYERRGFKVYRDVGKLFSKVDSTGKTWSWDAVFMRKDLL